MLGSTLIRFPASSSGVLVGPAVAGGVRSVRKRSTVVHCERNYAPLPKVKPLGRPTLLERSKDLMPFVERTKQKLSEYCTTVEGEECCNCWQAYFELQDLEKKWPAEKFIRFLQEASVEGMKSLIFLLHHAAMSDKESDTIMHETKQDSEKSISVETLMHIPDGIPKTQKEIDEEERDRMPDSAFTRILQSLRIYPSWYSERPDVETD